MDKLSGLLVSDSYKNLPVYVLADSVFEKISTEKAPQGIISVIKHLDFFKRCIKINKEDILDYYIDCFRLDSVPYISKYGLIKGIDNEVLSKDFVYKLTDEQFNILANNSFFQEENKNKNKEKNLDKLLADIKTVLPFGPKFYPDDMVSDHGDRFLIAELIREKILDATHEEVPHSIAVVVDHVKPCPDNSDYTDIYATIYVERDSQKRIIIGHNGELIKTIKNKSINDIKKLLECKVHLDLWVKVKKDWKDRPNDLNQLGYSVDNF